MANLVLNGKSIDSIDDIAENFVEGDVLREFKSGSLAAWLEEYGYDDELERVRSIKPTASAIRILAGISEALNLDDGVIAEAAERRAEQQRKEETARKAREEQQRKDEEARQRRASEEEQRLKEEKEFHECEQVVQNQAVQNIAGRTDTSYGGTTFGLHYINPEKCVACGCCKDACPADAITEGTPYAIDSDKCVDCGACAAECPNEAIGVGPKDDDAVVGVSRSADRLYNSYEQHFIDQEKCVACGACAATCPNDAIAAMGPEPGATYAIDKDKCVECGCCKDACPAEAIYERKGY